MIRDQDIYIYTLCNLPILQTVVCKRLNQGLHHFFQALHERQSDGFKGTVTQLRRFYKHPRLVTLLAVGRALKQPRQELRGGDKVSHDVLGRLRFAGPGLPRNNDGLILPPPLAVVVLPPGPRHVPTETDVVRCCTACMIYAAAGQGGNLCLSAGLLVLFATTQLH